MQKMLLTTTALGIVARDAKCPCPGTTHSPRLLRPGHGISRALFLVRTSSPKSAVG